MNVNTPTAKTHSGNGDMSGPEPKTASLIAMYGNEVSYAWNVLEDLKAAGASYTETRRTGEPVPSGCNTAG